MFLVEFISRKCFEESFAQGSRSFFLGQLSSPAPKKYTFFLRQLFDLEVNCGEAITLNPSLRSPLAVSPKPSFEPVSEVVETFGFLENCWTLFSDKYDPRQRHSQEKGHKGGLGIDETHGCEKGDLIATLLDFVATHPDADRVV